MVTFENNENKDKMMKTQKVFMSVKTVTGSSFIYIASDSHVEVTDISFNANADDTVHHDGYGYNRYEFENMMEIFNDPNMYKAFNISKDLVADLEDSLKTAVNANDENCADILSVYLHCLDYLDINAPTIKPHDDVRYMIIPADFNGFGFNAWNSGGNSFSFVFGSPICVYGIKNDINSAKELISDIVYNQIIKYAENRSAKIEAAEKTAQIIPDPWRDKSKFPMHLLKDACRCKNYPNTLDVNKLISSMYLDMGLEHVGPCRSDYSQMINDVRQIAASLAIIKITAKCSSNRRFRDKFVYVPYDGKSWAIPGDLMDAFIDIWSDNVYGMKNPIFNPIKPVPSFDLSQLSANYPAPPRFSEPVTYPEGYKPLKSMDELHKELFGEKDEDIEYENDVEEKPKPYNPIAEAVPVYGCPIAVPGTNGIEAVKDPLITNDDTDPMCLVAPEYRRGDAFPTKFVETQSKMLEVMSNEELTDKEKLELSHQLIEDLKNDHGCKPCFAAKEPSKDELDNLKEFAKDLKKIADEDLKIKTGVNAKPITLEEYRSNINAEIDAASDSGDEVDSYNEKIDDEDIAD